MGRQPTVERPERDQSATRARPERDQSGKARKHAPDPLSRPPRALPSLALHTRDSGPRAARPGAEVDHRWRVEEDGIIIIERFSSGQTAPALDIRTPRTHRRSSKHLHAIRVSRKKTAQSTCWHELQLVLARARARAALLDIFRRSIIMMINISLVVK